MSRPLTRVFTMRLKPGALREYKRLHRSVWPDLEAEARGCGVTWMAIYERDPLIVVMSEISRADAWDLLWDTDVHRRWGVLMEPLLEFDGDAIASDEMSEVYRLS